MDILSSFNTPYSTVTKFVQENSFVSGGSWAWVGKFGRLKSEFLHFGCTLFGVGGVNLIFFTFVVFHYIDPMKTISL